jgi:AcrR family transcriptional regulator
MSRMQDDQKRSSIMEAAFRVFGALGFQSTTIKRIADEAGIAPGSIYTYFRDKEDLFRAAVEEGWRVFLATFQDILGSRRPLEERIDRLIDAGFGKLKESLPLLRGMFFEASRMPVFRENLELFCDHVITLLEEGRKRALLDLDSAGSWKQLVRVIVNGAMITVALSPDAATDAEIEGVKAAVKDLIRDRLREATP